MSGRWLGVLTVTVMLAAWELLGRSGLVGEFYLPPVSKVAATLVSGEFLRVAGGHLGTTLWRATAGYAAAAALGVPLGVAVGRSERLRAALDPPLESLRPLPSSAIIPVALLFLGLGASMEIFVVAFGSLWPVLVATAQGARTLDPVMLETARLLKLSRTDVLLRVVVPGSAPFIAAGLRTSLAIALILAVTAEMIAGSAGIGFYILDMERGFATREMYAAIVAIGATGYLLNAAFTAAEARLIDWA